MFKKGDKIRLKKDISNPQLRLLFGDSSIRIIKRGGIIKKFPKHAGKSFYSERAGETGQDIFAAFGNYDFFIPETWIELQTRPGHHLTRIFK